MINLRLVEAAYRERHMRMARIMMRRLMVMTMTIMLADENGNVHGADEANEAREANEVSEANEVRESLKPVK